MPLSEDEQRILHEIEEQFYESDPAFARQVSTTTVYTHAFRNIKWACAGFVLGVAVMIISLSANVFVSFAGVVIMLLSAFMIERNARRLGKAGWEQMTSTMRGSGMRDYFGGAGKRMRDRFKREDD